MNRVLPLLLFTCLGLWLPQPPVQAMIADYLETPDGIVISRIAEMRADSAANGRYSIRLFEGEPLRLLDVPATIPTQTVSTTETGDSAPGDPVPIQQFSPNGSFAVFHPSVGVLGFMRPGPDGVQWSVLKLEEAGRRFRVSTNVSRSEYAPLMNLALNFLNPSQINKTPAKKTQNIRQPVDWLNTEVRLDDLATASRNRSVRHITAAALREFRNLGNPPEYLSDEAVALKCMPALVPKNLRQAYASAFHTFGFVDQSFRDQLSVITWDGIINLKIERGPEKAPVIAYRTEAAGAATRYLPQSFLYTLKKGRWVHLIANYKTGTLYALDVYQ